MRSARHFLPEAEVAANLATEMTLSCWKMRENRRSGLRQHAMQAAIEIFTVAELLVSDLTHARHDAHTQHDVNRIGSARCHLREW